MEMYVYEQSQDLFEFYWDKMKEEITYGGHVGITEYLTLLAAMDQNKMKDWERRMMTEVT